MVIITFQFDTRIFTNYINTCVFQLLVNGIIFMKNIKSFKYYAITSEHI